MKKANLWYYTDRIIRGASEEIRLLDEDAKIVIHCDSPDNER
jgi:hypothetical protein